MSNYTIDNLIPATAGEGRIPAIKIGDQVFTMVTSGGGDSSLVDLIQVTSYTAPVPEFTVPEVYSMSGMTSAANPYDPESPGIDFSVLNGTYTVTSDTASATDPRNRVYKHDSANFYLFHDGEEMDNYWLLGSSTGVGIFGAMLSLSQGEQFALAEGTQTWYNTDYDLSQSVTATITSNTTIPAVPMTLIGQKITSITETPYDSSRGVRTFVPNGSNVSFSAADETPVVSGLAMANGGRMIMQLRDTCTQDYGKFVANSTFDETGEWYYVSSGYVYYNNTFTANTKLVVNSGGIADSTTLAHAIGGLLRVSSGGQANNTTVSGGVLEYFTGGSGSTAILNIGSICISSGGYIADTTINGGYMLVYGSGSADNIIVSSGGSLRIWSGGTASNVTSLTDAHIEVDEGGVIHYAGEV